MRVRIRPELLLSLLAIACGQALAAGPEGAAQPGVLAPGSRPNILLIVADDLGQTDLGAYGSEIRTPNLDRLAARGTLLTRYYTAPLCAPTRAMLLSGTDPHRAGEGLMDRRVEGVDGYEGYLNHRVVSLATRLKAAGYHTYMAGKWHLGYQDDQSAATHGFERSFTLLAGGASHFDLTGAGGVAAPYRDDGTLVTTLPKGFYSTTHYTDRMLGYLEQDAADGRPFFAYLAYTAPHWPMQAPDEDVARQRGRYDAGFEVLRQQRFAACKARGFAPADAQLPNLPADYSPWSAMTADQRARSSRAMEVYAAMVERMDAEIGRVLDYLGRSGRLDNTLIMFQSDNGAEGGFDRGPTANDGIALDAIGRPGSWVYIGRGWAEAQSAPYFLQKFYAAEGGIRVPAFVYAPRLGVPAGRRSDALLTASDVAPTFLELAGAEASAPAGRTDALPITGRSFAAILRGEEGWSPRGDTDVVGWEHQGNAALRRGEWKLLWVTPAVLPPLSPGSGPLRGPGLPGSSSRREDIERGASRGDPLGKGGPWMLFNLREDPAELHDLSARHPDIKAQMLAEWARYVRENGVLVQPGEPGK